MGFRVDSFARVWSAEDKGKYSVCNLSVSRKNKETGQYDIEFNSAYVRFIGEAHTKIQSIDIPDRVGVSVKIKSCDVTNKYDKEKKVTYTNYVVFDIELGDSNSSARKSTPKPKKDDFVKVDDSDEDELPFN